jgi:surface-anchored protein
LAALLVIGPLSAQSVALADDGADPNLSQTLAELAIVHGERVIETGHIDMGPKYEDDGTWRFLIHDDAAKADAEATSVWRYPNETVFHVLDAATLTVPDDPAYRFLEADPGSEVYVIPQTQNPEVVWIGWNTQDPKVMSMIDRGVTLSLNGVHGPGSMTVYVQSGSFGEPQIVWESRTDGDQPVWVDVNTHTHANWVFTEPGVYLAEITAEADLIDGTHVSDTQQIRFAVGTATSPDGAFEAAPGGSGGEGASGGSGASGGGQSGGSTTSFESPAPALAQPASSPLVPILVGAIALVAVGLIAGFSVAIVRANRAKTRILARRAAHGNGQNPREGDGS